MKRALVLGSALAVLSAAPAAAQTEFGIDASVFSSYVWRGLSLTNKPVFQPDFWLSFPLGSASLTIGGWSSVDIGAYDGSDDIAEGGGTSLNYAEFDPYAEVGFSAGKASLALGGTAYIYPNDVGYTSDLNTVELYGRLELDAPLAPSFTAYYDVDKVKGFYFEGSVSHGVPLGASTLSLGALAGLSAGQHCSNGSVSAATCNHVANFDENGLTHIDLSAAIDFSAGPLSITPAFHFQISNDQATKINTLSEVDEDFKLWGGVTISWSKLFGGEAE